MKIKAELQSGDVLETDIPTNSRKEAAMQLRERYPKCSVITIDGRDFIGWCENTGHPILEGDNYQEDSSGITWLV